MESVTNTTTTYVNTVGSPKIVQKKRIHKKKPVVDVDETATVGSIDNTTFVSETDIDNLSLAMSALTMEEQKPDKKAKKEKQVKTPVVKEDDEASVHTVVLEKKPKKKATVAKEQQPVENPTTVSTEEEPKPVKKARAPRKPKAVEADPVENSTGEPVEPVKKARAPRKPKAVAADPVENSTGEPVEPVKKARAPRKPKAVVAADPVENSTGEPVEPAKKVKAPRKTKASKVEKKVVLHELENPNTVEQFFNILKPFIKQTSRYTALAEKPDGTIYPVFLKITGDFNEEKGSYPCQFYKDTVVENEETGDVESKPVWSSVLEKGELTMNQCFNILPFDKDFPYVYLKPLQTPV